MYPKSLFFAFFLILSCQLQGQNLPQENGVMLSSKVERVAKKIAKIDVFMRMKVDVLNFRGQSTVQHLDPVALSRGRINRQGYNQSTANGFYRKLDRFEFDRYAPTIGYNEYLFLSERRISQFDLLRKLDKEASDEELVRLTEHPNGVVRSYAFYLLLTNQNPSSFAILKQHLDDDEIIRVFGDYDVDLIKVGDLMIQFMTPGKHDSYLLKMTDTERDELNSLLLENPEIILKEKVDVLEDLPTTADHYDLLRANAYDKRDPALVIKLARYQREDDLEFFQSFLNTRGGHSTGYRLVREFPHPSFYESIKKSHAYQMTQKKADYGYLTYLYQALVQYPSPETRNMLLEGIENTHRKSRKKHRENIWLALHKYPDASLNDLKSKTDVDRYEQRRLMKVKNF